MPTDNAVVFKRKLSNALILSLTKPGKHADGEVPGLYLEVRPSSKVGKFPSKFWRLKYRLHGKENRFSIGAYPDIGLKEARVIARDARRDVANHIAPLKAKTAKIEAQLLNEERTFAYVAEQWLAFKSAERVTKSIAGFRGALKNHSLSAIGKRRSARSNWSKSPRSSPNCVVSALWPWPGACAPSSVPSWGSPKGAVGWSVDTLSINAFSAQLCRAVTRQLPRCRSVRMA